MPKSQEPASNPEEPAFKTTRAQTDLRFAQSAWRSAVVAGGEALASWFPVTLLIGICPGVFLWALHHPSYLSHLVDNRLGRPGRETLLAYALSSLTLLFCLYAAVGCAYRWREGSFSSAAPRYLNRLLCALLALPCACLLANSAYRSEHPFLTLLLICVCAFVCGISAATIAREVQSATSERAAWRQRLFRILPPTLVSASAGLYAAQIIDLQLRHHRNLNTGAFDLGIYTNVMWQSLHGDWLGCSFIRGGTHTSAHFDPILIALSPALLLHPGAETLIVLQALWLASGALPVFLLGEHHAGRTFGVVLALSYLLFPALHGINLFDFHSLSLAIPVLLWSVYFAEKEAWAPFGLSIAMLLLVREDQALQAFCVGLFAIAVKKAPVAGVLTIAAAAVYLGLAKTRFMADPSLFMADSEQSYGYLRFFSAMAPYGGGGAGIVETLLSNPTFVLQHILSAERLRFILQLLVPLAFLPLFAGRAWVIAGYGLAFLALVSEPAGYSISFHYSATVVPALFVLTARGYGRCTEALRRRVPPAKAAVAATLLVAAVASSAAFGALFPNPDFRAGWYRVARQSTPEEQARYRTLTAMKRRIRPDDSACASGFLVAHLAARSALYHLPHCRDARWVLARTDAIAPHERTGLRRLEASGRYRVVRREHQLVLLRRVDTRAGDEVE